jgi:PPOX class probable F420-dependent enzyme
MSAVIPDSHKDLLGAPVFVTCATVMPDGQPQAAVVWCSYDGERIWINSADGRQKNRNMARNPHVTVLAVDPQNPYRYLEVRGLVDEITAEGALEHINQLSLAYRGYEDYYQNAPHLRGVETRTIYKIRPVRVHAYG